MIKANSFVNKSKKSINDELRREYVLASKDEMFVKLCNRLKSDEDLLMKYTYHFFYHTRSSFITI